MKRRTFLQLLGASALSRPLWGAVKHTEQYFIFIHAAGGWDVTLWADPRNERKGLVEPASTDNTDLTALTHWKKVALDSDTDTFEILAPSDVPMTFGPGIGDLYDLRDRLTIVNGLAMNTVSHPDGTCFSATGRHLAGGRAPASSIDVAIANELGVSQLLPDVSIQFPSAYIGDSLDRRAIPLRVPSAATIAKSLARSDAYFNDDDRASITALLTDEAHALAKHSAFPETYERLAAQESALPKLLGNELKAAFTPQALMAAYPQLDYKAKTLGQGALGAAFAVEAMKRNLVRVVSFALGGLDTHNQNYKFHAHTQQELFGTIATMVKLLDDAKLSDRTHILVFSDFCRTPQINLAGGRDHYPNNSALVISPRFKRGRVFGKTDHEQLLPAGDKPLSPPDLLATFLAAFNIDPRRYLRDGDVIKDMLA
ncbi:MAG: DUF1501 domain-containing protein [Deltaproteobacteria bacterium]|nr:DUF1501 domain-containing protein [Deltaproteobacteria bacterium]